VTRMAATASEGASGASVAAAPWKWRRVAVHVTRGCELRLRLLADERAPFSGAVVFQEDVQRVSYDAEPGTVAAIFGPGDKAACAIGMYDPLSPLRLRVVAHGPTASPLDSEWVRAAIATAVAERDALFDTNSRAATTGYRLVNGENDGLPGLVVDRYGNTVVVKVYGSAWLPWMESVVGALQGACGSFELERVVLLLSREISRLPEATRLGLAHGDVLAGAPLDGELGFLENGIGFGADPVQGQKTGFFLDQRDNRLAVRALAAASPGCRVLNVFSYTGGFSLYAADGGAGQVTSVDLARAAIASVESNWARNAHRPKIAAARHEGIVMDAFEAMEQLRKAGRTFDLVIVDPPAFAQRERHVEAALAAYGKLAKLAVQLTAERGHVVLASCSSRVSADAFHGAVEKAAQQAGRPLDVLKRTGHACDHPVRAAGCTPYLKATFARPASSTRRR